jgi:asparagine synthase (glutamine-hydrolysing)
MCGICGIFAEQLSTSEREVMVQRMNDVMYHRGPDSQGLYSSGPATLAMRRLAIVDFQGGQQPLFNEAGDIAIVCNGEIYNHAELRQELREAGHRFSSQSDIEVILHAYEEHGIDALRRLRGMFAFALWDGRLRQLLLARDRLGEKPLYFHRDAQGTFRFASELRSITTGLSAGLELSPQAFNLFLTFQYIPEPLTPVAGIHQLPAGHFLILSEQSSISEPIPYWDRRHLHASPKEPAGRVAEAIDTACLLMGTADVPVGVALSGGIDSSLVAAITARHYPQDLQAFTIGYSGRPATDERSQAKELADHLGIPCTEIEIADQEVIDDFPSLMAYMDSPIADIAGYGYFAVSRAARSAGVPVLLSGMGGDEFFWGYSWVREAVGRNIDILSGKHRRSLRDRLLRRPLPSIDFFGVHSTLRRGDAFSRQLLTDSALSLVPDDLWLTMNGLDPSLPMHLAVSELLNRTWLRSNCLALVDRMSMAHSVEVRLPLLDVHLVNMVTGMRNDGLTDWELPHKSLLIDALANVLPAEVLQRRKQGFTPPVGRWMQGILSRYLYLLSGGYLVESGLVDHERLERLLPTMDQETRYKLLFIECWCRVHLRHEPLHALTTSSLAG